MTTGAADRESVRRLQAAWLDALAFDALTTDCLGCEACQDRARHVAKAYLDLTGGWPPSAASELAGSAPASPSAAPTDGGASDA